MSLWPILHIPGITPGIRLVAYLPSTGIRPKSCSTPWGDESAVLVTTFRCALLRQGRTGASRRSAANDLMVVPNHRCVSTRFPGLLCSCLLASACPFGLAASGQQIALISCFDGLFLLLF